MLVRPEDLARSVIFFASKCNMPELWRDLRRDDFRERRG